MGQIGTLRDSLGHELAITPKTIYFRPQNMRYKVLDQNGLNFLTLTIVEWIDIFTRPVYKDIIIDSLRFCQENKGLLVFGYVIMSNHLHLIARAEEEATGLSNILQSFKRHTARQFLIYMQNPKNPESRRKWMLNHFAFNARKNRTNSQHQVWQRDNHPFALYTPRLIRQKLAYLHYNPVRAKIVTEPEDYLHSSASNYVRGEGLLDVIVMEDIWNEEGYIDLGM